MSIATAVLAGLLAAGAQAQETPAAAAQSTMSFRIGAEPLLSAIMTIAEERIRGTYGTVRLLAATDEVLSGKWDNMRELFQTAAGTLNGVLWYVRPDGVYFTADKGLMARKVNDRFYFPRLMEGEPVVGELVISRTTSRPAAVVAVPVKKNKKVIGAVGVSLFLDEIARLVDEKTDLPRDAVFYAVDSKGRSALHRDRRFMFGFPAMEGSPSLAAAIAEMFSRKAGTVRYDFKGQSKTVVFKESRMTGWCFALGQQVPIPGAAIRTREQAQGALDSIRKALDALLARMDAGLQSAAEEVAKSGIGPAAREAVRRLCREHPEATDCAVVDDKGTMQVVEPSDYSIFEGVFIGQQEQVLRLQNTKQPVLSRVFRSVEGTDAVDFERPVLTPEGKFAGSVSILFRPEFLLLTTIAGAVETSDAEVWAVQKDGTALYDTEKGAARKAIFDALGPRIAEEETGSGTYFILSKDGRALRKEALWTSVSRYGTAWRLLVTRTMEAGEK
ncbi:MAG TPA: hypothetical protein DCM05_18205 [Elusimicrobia bacterium]|nr:hypothetical protein [Elusimicrobiota bacterium]